jgi:hypothetical protein
LKVVGGRENKTETNKTETYKTQTYKTPTKPQTHKLTNKTDKADNTNKPTNEQMNK